MAELERSATGQAALLLRPSGLHQQGPRGPHVSHQGLAGPGVTDDKIPAQARCSRARMCGPHGKPREGWGSGGLGDDLGPQDPAPGCVGPTANPRRGAGLGVSGMTWVLKTLLQLSAQLCPGECTPSEVQLHMAGHGSRSLRAPKPPAFAGMRGGSGALPLAPD